MNFVNYKEDLCEINPFVIKKYLEQKRWEEFKSRRDDVFVFQLPQKDRFDQVVIPKNKALVDCSLALHHAIATIADVERKTIAQMYLTLLNPNSDIITICVNDPNVKSGCVPLDNLIDFYKNVKNLIEASTRDVLQFKDSHDRLIQQLVSRCQIGVLEVGRYDVSVVVPLMDANGRIYDTLEVFDKSDECAESLTRKVTRYLIEGIRAVKAAVDTESEPQIQVSASFCDAVANICGRNAEIAVAFNAWWSPATKTNVPACSNISLDGGYADSIKSLSDTSKPKTCA